MVNKFLALFIFLNLMSLICNSQNSSNKYHCKTGDFYIKYSENVKHKKIPQSTNGKSFIMHMYHYLKNNVSYTAIYYPLVQGSLDVNNENSILLDNMVQGAADNSGGRIESTKNISYKGYSGREYVLKYNDGGIVKGRLYIIKNKVYMLQVIGPSSDVKNTYSTNVFLNSFEKIVTTKNSKKSTNEVKSIDGVDLSVLEMIILSSKNTVDNKLKRLNWNYTGTHNLEKFGKGYQYIYKSQEGSSQIIFYSDENVAYYVPEKKWSHTIYNEVKNKYNYSNTSTINDYKQEEYTKSKYTVFIIYTDKKMFLISWNIK